MQITFSFPHWFPVWLSCSWLMMLTVASDAGELSFSRDIAPLLAAKCYECHGPDVDQREAGLRLDQPQAATARLDSGRRAIVPGKSHASELWRRVTSFGDERMPPADHDEPLTPAEIELLKQWIDEGAAWQGHWAYEPLDRRSPPPVHNLAWTRNEVDRFILARLEEQALRPLQRAGKLELLRRAYFDLLGMPPSLEAIHAFLADRRPDAYERLVDQLLASPHYGERWGRHWLDVARYGDSNGGDENHAYPLAHRYRDYVVQVLNEDLPFDQFVRQQLAGDLLPLSSSERLRRQQLAATGYLAIGMKILAEQDAVKKRADMVDEQIDTFGRTFLGLSLGCARCHDHKFDPIPTRDYYALAGIFHSTQLSNLPLPSTDYEQQKAAHDELLESLRQQVVELQTQLEQQLDIETAIVREAESFDRGNVIVDKERYGEGVGIISDPGSQVNFAEYDLQIRQPGVYLLQLRYAAAEPRPGQLLINGEMVQDQVLTQATGSWMPDSQQWFTEGMFQFRKGNNTVRLQSSPMMSHIDKLRIFPHEAADRERWRELADLNQALRQLKEQAPLPEKVMAVADQNVSNVQVHVRGSHLNLGEEVHRGFLDILNGSSPWIPQQQSGRLQLANWLTENPVATRLTSRVIVNRLWLWHFGRGLVATPDDFGVRGSPPTHPQLLDFLAHRLMEDQWSWKSLHRLIMTSSTYQLATGSGSAARHRLHRQLYGRRVARRLPAEAIRDALLSHAGVLIAETGNAPMRVKSQDPSPEDMAKNLHYYENSPRRSIYLPVIRSNVYEFFTLFDFPNASTPVGKRNETTIPTQALWMMNSPFLIRHAEKIAHQAMQEQDPEQAIRELYLRLYCRRATAAEIARGVQFLSEFASSGNATLVQAWMAYCQVLLCSNEYLYLN